MVGSNSEMIRTWACNCAMWTVASQLWPSQVMTQGKFYIDYPFDCLKLQIGHAFPGQNKLPDLCVFQAALMEKSY